MFKNIKIQLLLMLCISLCTVSCLQDDGNYEYKNINEIKIDSLKEKYSVKRFDNFNIVPKVTNTQEESANLSYKWQAYKIGLEYDKLTDLSTEKNLTVPIKLLTGGYTIYYTVSDNNTGVEWQDSFEIQVTNSIYQGWLVLSDVNGKPRLDILSLTDGEYQMKKDIISGLVLDGVPGFVYCYELDGFRTYGVYVSTSGNGTVRLDPDTFSWNKGHNISKEFVSTQPTNLEVDNLISQNNSEAFIAVDGDIYAYYKGRGIYYNVPINKIDGETFEASPLIAIGNYKGPILYDNTNKRFVKVRDAFVSPISGALATKFDYTTGKDLLYMASSDFNNSYGAETFAILNDPVDNKKYVAQFNSANGAQSNYHEITAPNFDQATSYAVSPQWGYLFYAAGSKVYEYDISSKTTKLMIDKGTEEITLIKFQHFLAGNSRGATYEELYSNLASKLVVCSYNGSEGTMELYSVPPVNGPIKLESTYTGFGKIKSISYRERRR
ncbi:MAG: PKD-like family lipoprotein [Polaribacter sp.]